MESGQSLRTRPSYRSSVYLERMQLGVSLHAYDEIPRHLKDNPYITERYCCYLSARDCLKSMFIVSNEFFNIWTHLGMAFIWILIAIYDQLVSIPHYGGSVEDHYVYLTYVLCVTICMTASAGYHTFTGHVSEETHFKWHRFDICGIITGMLGCYIPGLHYGFWCHNTAKNTYLTLLGIMILLSLVLITQNKYLSARWRTVRLVHLSSLVGFGLIPAVHWTINSNAEEVRIFLPYIACLYLILGTAFLIYVSRIPERFLPGKFNVVGSSHNIWHILTAYSFIFWRRAALDLMSYRYRNGCT